MYLYNYTKDKILILAWKVKCDIFVEFSNTVYTFFTTKFTGFLLYFCTYIDSERARGTQVPFGQFRTMAFV